MTRVSVIIVAKNEEKYICDCLNSIINNNLKQIEIIYVDDHSTDNTVNIVKSFVQNIKNIPIKICYLHEKTGLSAGRNLGLSKAQGEYISFVDADDMIAPNMLLDYYYLAKAYNVPIVSGNLTMIDSQEQEAKVAPIMKKTYFSFEKNPNHLLVHIPSCCTRLWEHDFIVNESFYEGKKYEDIAFTYPLLIQAKHILEVTSACYKYRQTNGIMRSSYKPNLQILDILDIIEYLKVRCNNLTITEELKQSINELAKMHLIIIGGMLSLWEIDLEKRQQLMKIYNSLCEKLISNYRKLESPITLAKARTDLQKYYLMPVLQEENQILKRKFQSLIS